MSVEVICGDAWHALHGIETESVQCVVTSPPYWGLRNYGDENKKLFDASDECKHEWGPRNVVRERGQESGDTAKTGTHKRGVQGTETDHGQFCQKCGAWRGQLGLEPTPELYVEHLVKGFREIRRVLKEDGTLWLNLGDSYFGSGGGNNNSGLHGEEYDGDGEPDKYDTPRNFSNRWGGHKSLKEKDLVGIPWRVALALQEDGWYLRNDIIWHKPSTMPESVTDRCTTSHEHIFLLTKSKKYYYDHESIKEGYETDSDHNYPQRAQVLGRGGQDAVEAKNGSPDRAKSGGYPSEGGRNKRDVWSINPKPFKDSHFAVFPPELPKTCIKAGTDEGDMVLDPFCGAGTTGLVADRLKRDFLGIDLNPEYCDMARERIYNDAPMMQMIDDV